jgi:hypothetical protein
MAIKKFSPTHMLYGHVLEHERTLLLECVNVSIATAREQVLRSTQIVSHSHEIVGRTRLAMAHANRIRHGLIGPGGNPKIAPSDVKPAVQES